MRRLPAVSRSLARRHDGEPRDGRAHAFASSIKEPDFAAELEIARSLREQIDWDEVRRRTADSPFAKAFFTLVEELGIVEHAP